MDNTILGVSNVIKTNTVLTSTFNAPNSDAIDTIIDGTPHFYAD